MLRRLSRRRRGANALLLRGTEGEPVADPRRAPRIDVFVAGSCAPTLSSAAQEGVLTELPDAAARATTPPPRRATSSRCSAATQPVPGAAARGRWTCLRLRLAAMQRRAPGERRHDGERVHAWSAPARATPNC